ncbi:hypothetical protein [Alkalihalobacillus sp. TS-13]|nr:hypothetical protein [Alkalihalobacillus sp. TS-13]
MKRISMILIGLIIITGCSGPGDKTGVEVGDPNVPAPEEEVKGED